MEVKKDIIVNRSLSAVWEVLGNQYTEAYKWSRGLYHSQGEGVPKLEGAACNNRSCDTSFGQIREEIRVFKPNQQLSYEVIEGFPGFIKQGINNWYLEKVSEDRTLVSMHFVGETQGILGILMGSMMRVNLNKGLGEALEDFKHYLEKGIPSPGKVKDNQKNQKRLRAAA